MRALHPNTASPFETLPHVLRQDLINLVYWADLRSYYAPTPWECERFLCTLTPEQLAIHITALEKDKHAHPNLYGRAA